MDLKVYVDRISPPSRAVLILCKANGIIFEEVNTELRKGHHLTPQFAEINPMKQVPALVQGHFKVFESHSMLIYLASAFPGVADHWYPADLQQRAKVHSVLDWHHTNLRRGSEGTVALAFGWPLNPTAAAEGLKLLSASLATIESFWLVGNEPFLLGNTKPSIADLALVCEIMQLEIGEDAHERILGPHKRILKWIEDVKNATAPHFEEIHSNLPTVRAMLMEAKANIASKQ